MSDLFLETISMAMQNAFEERSHKKLRKNENIIIFGINRMGLHLKYTYENMGLRVNCFLDKDPDAWGKSLDNIMIYPITELARFSPENTVVSIATNPRDDIIQELKEKGFSYLDYFDILQNGILFDNKFIMKNLHCLKETYDLLADQDSKQILLSLLQYKITGDGECLKSSLYPQYFHPLVRPQTEDVIVDGGAFDGDSATAFTEYLKGRCKIFSFEPGEENYRLLAEKANGFLQNVCVPVKAAIWHENVSLYLDSSAGMDLKVGAGDGLPTKALNLDSFFMQMNTRPDLIKLDVEGSELNALQGCKGHIVKYQPRLQVCVYHKPDDLWIIPQYIKSLNSHYRFYLGHHTWNYCETVLYTVV